MRFSLSTCGFYPKSENYPALPADVIDITDAEYVQAMHLQAGEMLDVINGALVIVPAPAPSAADVMAATASAMTSAVQDHMDKQARTHGYDNLLSAISYADEPAVPKYQADGKAFRAWRSSVWAKCHELLAQVQSGTLPVPTESELLAMLPPAPAIAPQSTV